MATEIQDFVSGNIGLTPGVRAAVRILMHQATKASEGGRLRELWVGPSPEMTLLGCDVGSNMRSMSELLPALQRSPFRRSFRLRDREMAYLYRKGLRQVMTEGRDFVEDRLAPASPRNDGKQTPWGNHPIFVGQHATASCSRMPGEMARHREGNSTYAGRERLRRRCAPPMAEKVLGRSRRLTRYRRIRCSPALSNPR